MTKTDDENAPSDALTAWRKAFFTRNVKAFAAVFRSLAPLAPPDKRAGLLASIFIVVYLAFSLPALLAGVAVTHYGLRDTIYVYGIAVMALAALTALAVWCRRASSATAV